MTDHRIVPVEPDQAIQAWSTRSLKEEEKVGDWKLEAERAARDIWVYFKSFGRAGEGASETGLWFDNNKSLGGPQWLINRLAAMLSSSPKGMEPVAWRAKAEAVRRRYADQARFADHEAAAYFRDFVRDLDAILALFGEGE